ncbi:unnamed protein product [Linum tenue]|uniref:Uncharacterized protein n=1 Tax=Linum tenue TaxID=586396 RepID=A0AAV0QL80_9ROSI|nr:unnamed protein product [Linum tenue]
MERGHLPVGPGGFGSKPIRLVADRVNPARAWPLAEPAPPRSLLQRPHGSHPNHSRQPLQSPVPQPSQQQPHRRDTETNRRHDPTLLHQFHGEPAPRSNPEGVDKTG